MKIKVFIVAILLAAAASCTQKTCPTYTKDDVKKQQNEQLRV